MLANQTIKKASTRLTTALFSQAAIKIGLQLLDQAVFHEQRCSWSGDDFDQIKGEWQVVHKQIDAMLYSGCAGIAVFLARCSQQNSDPRFAETALAALAQSNYLLEKLPAPLPLGLYDGLGGLTLAAFEVALRLDHADSQATGCRLMKTISQHIDSLDHAGSVDLVSGHAGLLIALIRLSQCSYVDIDRALLKTVYQDIIERAQRNSWGWFWRDSELEDPDLGLCGLGHGAAGIALSLAEYHAFSGDPIAREAALEAIRYEQGYFDRSRANWPDLRQDELSNNNSEPSYPVYWCHGAAGIGLSRLRCYQLLRDESLLADAQAALQTAHRHAGRLLTSSQRSGRVNAEANISLCHGLGSIIELFLSAADVLQDKTHLNRARDIAMFLIKQHDRQGVWSCGVHGGGENPGLMLGLAGFGQQLLRLHPDDTPHSSSLSGLFECNSENL